MWLMAQRAILTKANMIKRNGMEILILLFLWHNRNC
jgi:hypothetical protein